MTASNFEKALKLVLVHEGGYVNHPADPGGATNKGVTQATYDAWRRRRGLATRSVRSITGVEVAEIYRGDYWNAVKGDHLPSGLDYAVFDFAVNSGPRRAAQFLQRILVVADDGIIGPATISAATRAKVTQTINILCDRRLAWLKTLRTWGTFGRGWGNRVVGVRRDALVMAAGVAIAPPRTGTGSENIRRYQQQLAALGYDPGPIDGVDGPRTRAAVMQFQREQGLAVDGIVGAKTQTALDRALETTVEPPAPDSGETSSTAIAVAAVVAIVALLAFFAL